MLASDEDQLKMFMTSSLLNCVRVKKPFHGKKRNNNFIRTVNYNMYRIEIKKSALKELYQITPPYNTKIIEAINELTFNPIQLLVKKDMQ